MHLLCPRTNGTEMLNALFGTFRDFVAFELLGMCYAHIRGSLSPQPFIAEVFPASLRFLAITELMVNTEEKPIGALLQSHIQFP